RASDPNAHSRGQVWTLDEETMTATLVVNADLGNYSNALGAAQRLSNGDYSFTSGRQGQPPNLFGQSIEVSPDGAKVYALQANKPEYRSYRMRTLYEGVDDALAGAPTDIALSPSSVAENQPVGTTVGILKTTDPNMGDTFTYVLVAGATDNASFTISGGTLQTAASFDFETKSSYSIRVRSTDAGGLFVEKVFTISVTNVNEAPTITVPGAQTADEDVDKAISGLSVGDPEGDSLTVTLAVGHGTLTLGTTTGLAVTG